ncbi:MAG: hypothetical protein ACR2GW_09395 [Pyrinomonadaceae bacterium]
MVVTAPATPVSPAAAPIDDPSAPAGWKRFLLGGNSFSVVLPKAPQVETERKDLGGGVNLTVNTYSVDVAEGVYVFVYVPDFPFIAERVAPSVLESFYSGVWEGFAEGTREEIAKSGALFELKQGEQHDSTLGGLKGREQDFTLGPLSGRARATATGRRVFLAMSMWSPDMPAAEREIIFNSFRISSSPAVKARGK